MRYARPLAAAGVLAVCGAVGLSRPPEKHGSRRVAAPTPRSASEAALREAGGYLTRAQLAVNAKRYTLADWDPRAAANSQGEEEPFRQQSMAREHGSELHAARTAAQRAITLAQTAEDRWAAVYLLVWIEHNAGRHAEELRQARRLMRLAPRSQASREMLEQAMRCAGERRWARPAGVGAGRSSP